MKVIDILTKIANGEEVKFKLIEDDTIYSIKKSKYLHLDALNEDAQWFIDESWLNEEVEILDDEEDKDIPLIPDDELYEIQGNNNQQLNYNFKVLKEKINQVIEAINNGNS